MKTSFVFIAFLVLASLAHAGRPAPVERPEKTGLQGVQKETPERAEGCEDVGADECLMRRSLAAHTDYIYTQEHH
ncbi:Phytosulfokine precursor protein (PSK) [Musa troglodytarum]|uniref:Phytosulfokine n=1 Tax=Musa troglodytarum TaxID=320322 RepID=A0A9E7GCF0_9LILI|nr:Phytosulfokine precursor protein (PSK) [Musa troglodytarum]